MLAKPSPIQAKPKLLPKPGSVKVVQALYSYEARTVDELTFEEGDTLYVYEQSNDGWWRAKCKGKSGLIPHNYVEEGTVVKEPLHESVRRGNLSFLKECLDQGVSSTSLDAMGNTALYWAAHSGHMDCLLLLLEQPNPPINAQNKLGDTPLHAAASKGNLEVVETLLEHGADSSLNNSNSETAENLALDKTVRNIIQLNRPSRNSRSAAFDPEDYDDDSDS